MKSTDALKPFVDDHKSAANRAAITRELRALPQGELIERFFIEMDAKNQAYDFIIQSGLMLEFREHCYQQTAPPEKGGIFGQSGQHYA